MSMFSTPERPESGAVDSGVSSHLHNGLRAAVYVPLTDVDQTVGAYLLNALGRARIAAYLRVVSGPGGRSYRVFVAADERIDARTIVAAAVRALGAPAPELPEPAADPLAGIDADAEFEALVADWHVDTHEAIRAAERDLRREDAEWRARLVKPPADDPVWLDDDHYIPPPPPPLPRLAAPTIVAMAVLALSILVLGAGGQIGVASGLTLVLGICGLLLGVGILLSRVRDRHDDDDDGAAI